MRALLGWFEGWRGLARFWAAVAVVLIGVGAALQLLGPPPRPAPVVQPGHVAPPIIAAAAPEAGAGRATQGPIAEPDPALLESWRDGASLPRIAADGRAPMRVYAAGFDPRDRRPRAAVLMGGIGMHAADTEHAARTLPAAVSFAIPPYLGAPDRILPPIRRAGHEILATLPMEPVGFPLNDPGPRALTTEQAPERNRENLLWSLSRIQGFVGATNAFGPMRGERFAELADQMAAAMAELASRGLLFVDARGGAVGGAWGRGVDVVLDDTEDRDRIDARLDELSTLAREKGSALGLAMLPRPATVDHIAAWANGLAAKGVALAPVSAIALAPATAPKGPAK